ncbi:MAG: type II toxin-antitoxin system HicB family antitoxin [Marinifilaceae bacterium]
MEKVKAIVRVNKDGLWAEIPELPGCFTFGESIAELHDMLKEATDLHIEGMREDGDEIPLIFKKAFGFELKINLQEFFSAYPISVAGLAKRAGMNRSLLTQYSKGDKLLSEKQALRITSAINSIGRDLIAVSF